MAQAQDRLFGRSGLATPEAIPETAQPHIRQLLDSFAGNLSDYDLGILKIVPPAASWQGMVEAITILPELTVAGHDLIERHLGYRPHVNTMQWHDAFLRALIMAQRAGQLLDEDYRSQVDYCVTGVRNSQMIAIRWQANEDAAQKRYETNLLPFAQSARARLSQGLGYSPELKHSLAAELWFRQVLAQDSYRLPDYETPLDRKAITYVRYREVLTSSGKAAADGSRLLYSTFNT